MSILFSVVNSFGSTLGSAARRALGPEAVRTQQRRSMSYWEGPNTGIWSFMKTASTLEPSERTNIKNATSNEPFPRPPGPYAGRSVPVNNEKSFSGAYMELQQILRRNLVSYELRLAERHEKKGYKRRRLASDRHRRRFAHEVRKKVQLVNEIRARGA